LLIEDLTASIYINVCRGLFEKDKLLYSFMMSAKISLAAGEVRARVSVVLSSEIWSGDNQMSGK
jgi:hypothetical protein